MTQAIRMLHFADIHIGMENYGKTNPESGLSSRVHDFLRRMDEMIAYAHANEVDLTIFAGDAFKTRSPNPTFQREFAWRVRELAEIAPLVLLVGNHDLPPNILRASSIEIYDTLAVPGVWVANDYEVRIIETRRGPVVVGAAPYPIRARLLQDVSTAGLTIAQTDALLEENLTALLDEMATEADAHNIPRVLTGHFTVSGATVGSERSIMLGRDIAVGLAAIADPRWDYVALGHIHKHQNLTRTREDDAPPVVYSGSMERIDFGEEADTKGFCWVELERQNTRWQFIPVEARRMVTLRADLRTDDNPTQTLLQQIANYQLEGAVVRLLVDLTPESEARLNERAVLDALTDAQIYHMAGLRKQIERPERARLGDNPEGLTPAELLERYLNNREVDPARQSALLEAAHDIFQASSALSD